MSMYIGVNGVARKVVGIWIGVNGVARKVINGYVGINGVPRQFYTLVPYTWKFQSGTNSSSYGVVNSYSREYVTDHWELYLNSTVTTSNASYVTFNEIKVSPNSESLVYKTVTLTYKLNTYDSSGIDGYLQAFDSSGTWIGGIRLTSTSKTTITYTVPSNASFVVITNRIWKVGTYSNVLYVYSLKVGDEVLI